jgi:hypothetical protein
MYIVSTNWEIKKERNMFTKGTIKLVVIVVIALALSGFTYAFAAANTVPATYAGDGAGTISGYTITNVVYHLNGTTPSEIDSVTFTLSAPATNVSIKLVALGSTYYTCSVSGGTSVTCNTLGATVVSATELRVIASN